MKKLFLITFLALIALTAPSGSVQLAWDAPSDFNVTRYWVYAAEVGRAQLRAAAVSPVLPAYFKVSDRPAVFTNVWVYGLKETSTYSFYATAVDDAGTQSVPSNSVEYTVPIARPVLNVVKIGTGYVRLGWRDIYDAETGWEIEKSTDAINFSHYATLPAGQSHVNDLDVEQGGIYYYRITALVGTQRSIASRIVLAYTEK